MKVLAIIALSIMIIIASLLCLMLSICAASSGLNSSAGFGTGERVTYAVGALVALASIIGMVKLIGKLNRTD